MLLGGLVLWCAAPASLVAQEACEFVDPGNDVVNRRPPFAYVTNPHFLCEDGVEIWGDSAVVNSDQAMFRLMGSARYIDGTRELNSAEVRYFYDVGRLQAQGRVRVDNYEDGSTIENGDLVYLRETEYRDVEEMTVTTGDDGIRPRATVYPERRPAVDDSTTVPDTSEVAEDVFQEDSVIVADPAAGEPDEYVVIGDRIFFRGDSYFNAVGSVEIVRDSLHAFADSADYEGDVGELQLEGSARVEGSGYDLVGNSITLASAADGTDEVRARRNALLTGDDLLVAAPQVRLYLLDGELERMVAVPLGEEDEPVGPDDSIEEQLERPLAVSGAMELRGDSLDLAAPAGVLQRIFAAGTARSVSAARTELNVESLPDLARQDWIEGDTIEVLLEPVAQDSVARPDTAQTDQEYEVDRVIARLGARSLYRLSPSDSTAVQGVDPPALSYIIADQITIFMVAGAAERVESIGDVSGWHLEPLTTPAAEPVEDSDLLDAAPDPLPADPPPVVPDDVRGDAGAP